MLTKKQREALALGPKAGGKAVKSKQPPANCPKCGRSMAGRSWHSYLGHLQIHARAEKNGWTYEKAAHDWVAAGLQASEAGMSWANGAWANYNNW